MYLASKSPQRRALLDALGISFEILVPAYREGEIPGLPPERLAEEHSRGKALSVMTLVETASAGPVLGVDTIVVSGDEIFGKPSGRDQAAYFLKQLSGGTHQVISGLTLAWPDGDGGAGEVKTSSAVTEVTFMRLNEAELGAYLDTGEWRSRAGGYAIQGRASAFVAGIRGDYTNVVGLPVPLLVRLLKEKGAWPPAGWKAASD